MTEPASVRVMVVDDQEPFRLAARTLVKLTDGFEMVGEAASGEEAIELVDAVAPDLILMDVNLPGIDGVEATRRITNADSRPSGGERDTRPAAPVVLLCSTYEQDDLPERTEGCGAVGYVHKEHLAPAVLVQTWRDHGR